MDEQAKDSPYVEIFSGPLCGYCHRAKAVLARHGLRCNRGQLQPRQLDAL